MREYFRSRVLYIARWDSPLFAEWSIRRYKSRYYNYVSVNLGRLTVDFGKL